MARVGFFPNVHVTTEALFSKMVHEGGRGVKNLQKTVHMVYGCHLVVRTLSSDLGMEKSPAQSLVVLILVGLEGEVLSMIVNCDLNTLLSTYYSCQGIIHELGGGGFEKYLHYNMA